MIEIKTESGFVFTVSKNAMKDWRVVKALSRSRSAKDDLEAIDALSEIIAILLKDREEDFYRHLMDADGVVDAEKVIAEAKDIINKIGEQQKNS